MLSIYFPLINIPLPRGSVCLAKGRGKVAPVGAWGLIHKMSYDAHLLTPLKLRIALHLAAPLGKVKGIALGILLGANGKGGRSLGYVQNLLGYGGCSGVDHRKRISETWRGVNKKNAPCGACGRG